jgi:hypothetical protein
MEHLWSRAVATSGNRWQMGLPRKRLEQAKTVAVGCDQLPIGAHGKEGVDAAIARSGARLPAEHLHGVCSLFLDVTGGVADLLRRGLTH